MIPPGANAGVALSEQGGRELGISAETCDASRVAGTTQPEREEEARPCAGLDMS